MKVIKVTRSGETVTTEYKCPCGKGKCVLTEERIPGYYDFYAHFTCEDCDKKYEIQWGRGVSPGKSPMLRERF